MMVFDEQAIKAAARAIEIEWQPIETAPIIGRFMIAGRFPTSWAWSVALAHITEHAPPKYREMRLRGYSHWAPFTPPESNNDI